MKIPKKEKFDKTLVKDGGVIELSDEMDKLISEKIEQSEKDIEKMRMQIRWGAEQVGVIKEAAAIAGLPYQTYIKVAAFDKATGDIEKHRRRTVSTK